MIKKLRHLGLGLTLFTLLVCSGTDDGNKAALEKRLTTHIQAVHERQQNVGVSVAILRGSEIIYEEQLGMADLDHGIPVSRDTRFGIASITKLITAVAILHLYNAGEIDLDAPIQDYAPTYPIKAKGEITPRMLLMHTAGIPHPRNRTPELYATHYFTATEAITFFAEDTLQFEPGSEAAYSSSNYNLLAAAIEGISGESFNDYISSTYFDPLGLSNTSFDNVLRPLGNRTERYAFYHPRTYAESSELYLIPKWDYSFNPGGGNIISTPTDLVHFGAALMQPGLLAEEALDSLFSEELFGSTDSTAGSYIYATGSNHGLQAALTIFPKQKVAVAVLANTWGLGSRSGEMVALARELGLLVIKGE